MRVALLSLIEPTAGEPQGLRGYLPIGGRSIARHQLGLALAFGCTRIVVLAETLTAETMALQQIAEESSARLHVIAAQRSLVPLVAPEDELFVFADGLLAIPGDVLALLGDDSSVEVRPPLRGPAILTVPVEEGLAAGFERIDINHASAGAMRLPGRVVAGLADLPADWHAVSALLRLAVQARVPLRALPDRMLAQGRWRLVRSEQDAQAAEPEWLRLHTDGALMRSPGEWIAARTVRAVGPALLHAGTRPVLITLAGLILILLAAGSGWFGLRTPGFAMLALASVVFRVGGLLARIERNSLLTRGGDLAGDPRLVWLIDGALVALATWRGGGQSEPAGMAWFVPLVLILLLHLSPRILAAGRWSWWLDDRFCAGVVLALASALLPFDFVIRGLVLALVIGALVSARRDAPFPNPELTIRS